MKTYCLGYTHTKCDSCQHEANWQTLNQLPDALRLALQSEMTRINDTQCRLTQMGQYIDSNPKETK